SFPPLRVCACERSAAYRNVTGTASPVSSDRHSLFSSVRFFVAPWRALLLRVMDYDSLCEVIEHWA
ncbi:MAG: hypothetical protein RR417_04895, partial [Kiritimatiellia bacterium]